MKRELVLGVMHYKCHIKDIGKLKLNKKAKWDQLLVNLRSKPLFLDESGVCKLKIKHGAGLQSAFKRFQNQDLEYITNSAMNL